MIAEIRGHKKRPRTPTKDRAASREPRRAEAIIQPRPSEDMKDGGKTMTTGTIAELVTKLETTSNIIYDVMNLVRAVCLIQDEECRGVNDEIAASLVSHAADLLIVLNTQAQETLKMAVEIQGGDRA